MGGFPDAYEYHEEAPNDDWVDGNVVHGEAVGMETFRDLERILLRFARDCWCLGELLNSCDSIV